MQGKRGGGKLMADGDWDQLCGRERERAARAGEGERGRTFFTRAKLGSNRRWSAVISLISFSSQKLMASIVSLIPVAMGFSQNTCLPAAAHALI